MTTSDVFFGVVVVALAIGVIQSFFNHSRASQRRMYWTCAAISVTAGLLAFYPPWTRGLGASAFLAGVMVVIAYAYTPYIKIRGRICSLGIQTPDPEDVPRESASDQAHPAQDAYGGTLTAAKMWWILVPLMLISAVNTYAFATGEGEWWVAAIGIVFLLFLAITSGYGDASWGYPIARGQRIQFIVLVVVTLGTFTLIYLVAYGIAKRRPVRSRHSSEHRAQRHLGEEFPRAGGA